MADRMLNQLNAWRKIKEEMENGNRRRHLLMTLDETKSGRYLISAACTVNDNGDYIVIGHSEEYSVSKEHFDLLMSFIVDENIRFSQSQAENLVQNLLGDALFARADSAIGERDEALSINQNAE